MITSQLRPRILPVLLLSLWLAGLSQAASAQDRKVSVSLSDRPLSELIRTLERQTGKTFFYSTPPVDLSQKVSVDCRNATLEEALSIAMDALSLTFSISGQKVYLSPRNTPKGQGGLLTAQGTICDEAGVPITGAYVYQKDAKTNGAVTDVDGRFSLTVPATAMLVASSIGYFETVVPAASQMDIVMHEDVEQLEDAVVIGYGSVRKKDLTGSVAHVQAEQYDTQSNTNVLDMLAGTVAGFYSTQNTSIIGSDDNMIIRGTNSLSAGNTPLVVLDGVIYEGRLDDINPNDIASIDILKDASSAAVYGARAANGVLIISTKTGGKTDKMSVTFSAKVGLQDFTNNLRPNGVEGYLARRADYLLRTGGEKPAGYYSNPENLPAGVDLDTWLSYGGSGDPITIWTTRLGLSPTETENYIAGKTFDWYDLCTQTGLREDYNISVSNGTGRSKYYVSLNRMENRNVWLGDTYILWRARANVETQVTSWFKFGLNAQFTDKNTSSAPVKTDNMYLMSPLAGPFDAEGNYVWYPVGSSTVENPLMARAFEDRFKSSQYLFSTVFGEIRLPFGFTYRISWNNRYWWDKTYFYNYKDGPGGQKYGGRTTRTDSSSQDWQLDNILSWRKTFGVHDFYLTLMYGAQEYRSWSATIDNRNFETSEALSYHSVQMGTNQSATSEDIATSRVSSMARLNYTLMDRYLFTGTVRRDGYSAFGINHPYGVFPSVGLAWVVSNEPFFHVGWVDNLKLRASYGLNGNSAIGPYEALSKLSSNFYSSDGVLTPTLVGSTMSNADLKWEKTGAFNFGLDFSVLGGRLGGSVDVYKSKTTDLLMTKTLPSIIGYASVMSNLGRVDNKGVEVSLNSVNINKPDFRWTSQFTFSANRNTIVHLSGEMVDILDDAGNVIGQKEADDYDNHWFIGHAIDQIWDYKQLGIYQLGEETEAERYGKAPGDVKLFDVDDSGTMTSDDKLFQGFTSPRAYLGLTNTFTLFKNWEITAFLRADLGFWRPNSMLVHSGLEADRNHIAIPYWSADKPSDKYTRLQAVNTPVYTIYEDASFLRLQKLTVAYSLPKRWLSRIHAERIRVYYNGSNLLTFSKWSGWDPESGTTPMPRIDTFGIDVTF